MNESNLWEWLRDVVLPLGHYSRIESPDTAPGFPDVHFQVTQAGKGQNVLMFTDDAGTDHKICTSGTLELKATDRILRVPFPDEEKGLHASQLKWIRAAVEVGGIVWIIAETPGAIYIIHGKDAAKFNGATHEELIEMAWQIMHRTETKQAVSILDAALRVPENYRQCKEYVRDNT